jgi:hypothetical protein
MANAAQFDVIVYPARNYTYNGLDKWHFSPYVEGYLAEYKFIPAGRRGNP